VTYTGIEIAAILKRRTALDHPATAALYEEFQSRHFAVKRDRKHNMLSHQVLEQTIDINHNCSGANVMAHWTSDKEYDFKPNNSQEF